MLPVIAIAGRPNVGKSTLFNCLTRSRAALVADEPGLTRDRIYGIARPAERPCLVVDTGGLSDEDDVLVRLIGEQAGQAIRQADVVLFVVDAREGLTAADESVATRLRRAGRPVVVVVNKVDGLEADSAAAEFHRLGFEALVAISAAHGRGIRTLETRFLACLPPASPDEEPEAIPDGPRVCLLGRPNVGKSTLVNRLCGEERVLAHDMPGTTRDSIYVPMQRGSRRYVLIDTAGIRRRARVGEGIEKFSVLKALGAVEHADVVIVLLDAEDGITDQDAHLAGLAIDAGRAVVFALNKWDRLDGAGRESARTAFTRRLGFAAFAAVHPISALRGTGLGAMMRSVDRAHAGATRKLVTSELTRVLDEAVQRTPPPAVRGRRIKLRYAHQGGTRPPRIVVHGNQTDALPDSYRRYLERYFREALELEGTPVVVELRKGTNPYAGRRNTLTPRQQRHRKRLVRRSRR